MGNEFLSEWQARIEQAAERARTELAKVVYEFYLACEGKKGGTEFQSKAMEWLSKGANQVKRLKDSGRLFSNYDTLDGMDMNAVTELTTKYVDQDVLDKAIKSGEINGDMPRSQVREWKERHGFYGQRQQTPEKEPVDLTKYDNSGVVSSLRSIHELMKKMNELVSHPQFKKDDAVADMRKLMDGEWIGLIPSTETEKGMTVMTYHADMGDMKLKFQFTVSVEEADAEVKVA